MLYIIYRIYSNDNDYVYVGSTRNFTKRKCAHKNACNNESHNNHNLLVYTKIRENGGWYKFAMVPIEEFECETIQQAHIREQHWITQLKPQLNGRNAFLDDVARAAYQRDFYENNREARLNYQHEYDEANRDSIAEKQRLYYEANRESILAQQREYRREKRESAAAEQPTDS